MKATILNGSLSGQTNLDSLQNSLIIELHKKGWETEAITLNKMNIKPCIGCFRCWHSTPGICSGIKGDDAEEITKKTINSQLLVFLTPLTYGGYSSEIKKIYGRFLGLLQPGTQIIEGEVHHLKRYDTYPSFIAIAMTNELVEKEIKIFKTLVDRNSKNFYPPKYFSEVLTYSDVTMNEKVKKIILEVSQ